MRLIILGAGGFGHTIKDICEQSGIYTDIILLDDDLSAKDTSGKLETFTDYIDDNTEFYPAIGDNQKRYYWILKLDEAGAKITTIKHASAYISPTATIGKGSAILPNSTVGTNVAMGYGCIVNLGSIIDHDTFLGNAVHVAPGAVVKGENLISAFTKVDSGTVIEAREYPIDH